MREIVKITSVLFIICLLASGLLAFANELTSGPIAASREKTELEALTKVMKDVESTKLSEDEYNEAIKDFGDSTLGSVDAIYVSKKGEEVVGYIYKCTVGGFGGDVVLLAGINMDSTLSGAKVITHSETAGLGATAANEGEGAWINQYEGKSIATDMEVIKSGTATDSQVNSITGSTITSVAVTGGVNLARAVFLQMTGGAN